MIVDEVTHVVLLSPPGRGAIATVLVDGPLAEKLMQTVFVPANGKPISEQVLERILFGRWGAKDGEEVVVCRRNSTQIEVHCHGGAAASTAVVDRLVEAGGRGMSWSDWLVCREPDPVKAQAQLGLGEACTRRTAAILLDQYAGALRNRIDDVQSAIEGHDERRALEMLRSLLTFSDVGLHLVRPWRVVLGGLPNVGKSSLINSLLGYQRAIVFDSPGTTRDVVTAVTALDGWPIELADTAGIRVVGEFGQDDIEAAGIQQAKERLATADAVVWVHDVTCPWRNADPPHAEVWPDAIVVHNKCDLVELSATPRDSILTSARTGHGIDRLAATISERLVPNAPPIGEAVPFTRGQIDILREALEALDHSNPTGAIHCLGALGGGSSDRRDSISMY